MEYLVEGTKYNWSYNELKNYYDYYCNCKDNEFIKKIPSILHLCCFICYVKEVPTYICLSDKGIIHELAHIIEFKDYENIREVRKLFETTCKLV